MSQAIRGALGRGLWKTLTTWAVVLGVLLAVASTAQGTEDRIVYYHTDVAGSPVAATDDAGAVRWRETYAPYGARLTREAQDNRLWFTGKGEDSALDLHYYGARWYDARLGRFLSMDPAGFDAGNVQLFNSYAYANNNPYAYMDPDGREGIGVGQRCSADGDTFSDGLGSNGLSPERGARDILTAIEVVDTTSNVVMPGKGAISAGVLLVVKRMVVRGGREARQVPKKVPNPHGSRGGPAHTSTIERRIDELKGQGHEHLGGGKLPEEVIQTPGGCKSCRRPDITTRAPDGAIYRENVGRSTGSGSPIARERRALDDIGAATGQRPGYTPYYR